MIFTPHLLHGFGGERCQRKGTKCNTRVMGALESCPSVTAETGPSSVPPRLRYPEPERKPQVSAPSSTCPERTSPASQPLGPQGALRELAPLPACLGVSLCSLCECLTRHVGWNAFQKTRKYIHCYQNPSLNLSPNQAFQQQNLNPISYGGGGLQVMPPPGPGNVRGSFSPHPTRGGRGCGRATK